MTKNIRTYSELITLPTFEERFEYLNLDGVVGKETFGFERYLNQLFYNKSEWRKLRDDIILRDNGHDMAMADDMYEIAGSIIIHHMNPVDTRDIVYRSDYLLNPEYLISVSAATHRAIHYGTIEQIKYTIPERHRNDTCPWKH